MIANVFILSLHLNFTLKGHVDVLFCMFGYLERNHKSKIIFGPSYPDIKVSIFMENSWGYFHGYMKKPIPQNSTET